MNTLLVLRDHDTGSTEPAPDTYAERTAARAVVRDAEGKVGLIYSIPREVWRKNERARNVTTRTFVDFSNTK